MGRELSRSLIANAPDDTARIERVAGQVIGELEPTPETFYERNQRVLERMGKELAAWNKDKRHDASVKRIPGRACERLRQVAASRSRSGDLRRRAFAQKSVERSRASASCAAIERRYRTLGERQQFVRDSTNASGGALRALRGAVPPEHGHRLEPVLARGKYVDRAIADHRRRRV
jgi:hypothetical protein